MLLAVDTSTRHMGIALYDGIQVLTEAAWVSQFHHTVELAPAVEQALRRAGVGMEAVQALGVATGPGSFTSLRTGLAFIKGLALARRLPVIGVRSLDILAAGQPVQDIRMAAVLEVGRQRLAVGWYFAPDGRWQQVGAPEMLTVPQLSERIQQPTWICGEMDAASRQALGRKWKNARIASPAQCRRQPAFLAELAWERWQAGEVDDPVSLAPFYLSDPAS